MVVDYTFLFDMMMTAMMHYSGNEDHFCLCHRHWDFDNLLHLALKDALLKDQVRNSDARSKCGELWMLL